MSDSSECSDECNGHGRKVLAIVEGGSPSNERGGLEGEHSDGVYDGADESNLECWAEQDDFMSNLKKHYTKFEN